ncbi:PKD domain-containing protein [Actinomadura flavalba]|uniref:PKD domain-containing protein n=1 Tax=Actinomadura flavalba TaxID=1120938 RepID=UPI0003A116AD|nr:PKD domain-containing protein [Actinomadura flavalba]
MGRRRLGALVAGAALVLGTVTGIAVTGPATAEQRGSDYAHGKVVNADPVDYTPHAQDGDIKSLVKLNGKIYAGGSFTKVKEQGGGKPVLTRNRLFAFDAETGAIDPTFAPDVDKNEVSVVLPAPDGQSLYVGGNFGYINGVRTFVLARIDAQTGAPITSFQPQFDARVRDLRFAGGRLYVAGTFSTVGGQPRQGIATIDPQTGARDDFLNINLAGTQTGTGVTQVYKMDVTPDGSKLVGVGNFSSAFGVTRRQIVMLDLTGASATLANWDTNRYADQCSQSFDTYMRDIDFSPDGSFFVVTTTGAYGAPPKLCDTHARWETAATGAGQQPTWINTTGGDTSYAVEITDTVVYAGGHFRWANNPFAADNPGQGAVSRRGIVALDPVNGIPYSWNPGRTLGVGVFDLLATSEGLWMGSDTDEAGGEWHQKLAMFPLAGGTTVPRNDTGALPGNVYSGGGIATLFAQNYLRHRSFNGSTTGGEVTDGTAGFDWRTVRGSFMVNGELFYGHSDNKFYRRTFNGTTLGAATAIDAADQLTNMSSWHNSVPNIKGMFYANGRIYYTRGQSSLYYRGFTPESNIVGAQENTATGNLPGMNWNAVGGMFVNDGKLYYVNNDNGRLFRVDFSAAGVPSGTPVQVSTADWRGRAVFLYAGVPNQDPLASFTTNCTELECTFNGSASEDPDGTIASYAWDFGDGENGTGATASHTYDEAGTYTVKLTVTDNQGGTGTRTQQVTVTETQTGVSFRGVTGANGNGSSISAQIPTSVQPGDGLLLITTYNSSGAAVTTPPAGWTEVDTQNAGAGVTSTVWKRVAQAGDAGSAAGLTFSAITKADVRVLAYQGTHATDPIASVAKATDATAVTAHAAPAATVPAGGGWVVSYWGDKSSSTTAWTAPSGVETRATGIGSASGRITTLVADSGGAAPAGAYPARTAETDAASRALMWTIVLARKP